jgi:hypothetical protein
MTSKAVFYIGEGTGRRQSFETKECGITRCGYSGIPRHGVGIGSQTKERSLVSEATGLSRIGAVTARALSRVAEGETVPVDGR